MLIAQDNYLHLLLKNLKEILGNVCTPISKSIHTPQTTQDQVYVV